MLTESLKGLHGLCVANFFEGCTRMSTSRHCDKLRVAKAFEGDKPEDRSFNRGTGSQKAMVT